MSEQYSHDVFISFSFADQDIAEEIVNTLTSQYGFSCWICTRDIEGGKRYKALILRAIYEARAVVFIQSENALASKEIPKEIGKAFDADKTIIPFKLDQAQPQGDLEYDLYGVEYIDATITTKEQGIYELAKAISKAIGKPLLNEASSDVTSIKEMLISTPSVIPKSVFCGREDVIKDIAQRFDDGERVVFVQGIGGIGKTEIVKQYAKRYKSNYDTIIFATYADSLLSLINSETPFEIEPEFSRLVQTDGVQEDEHSFFERKLKKIQKLSNERTLIIIDNFDVEHDDALTELMKGKYRLLITTRCDYSRVYPCVKIGPIESIESLVRVFMENYQGFDVDENDLDLVELIELVNRHTYTIELLAQHMENSGQTAREMIEALHSEGILSLNEEVQHAGNKTQVAYKNLLKMFKVFDLSDSEKIVLRYLSLMPLSGVSVRDFKEWANLNSPKILRDLEGRSWITRNVDGIALHPIIRDVIKHELPSTAENCREFMNCFSEAIEENKAWNYSVSKKELLTKCCFSIIDCFEIVNSSNFELQYKISVYLNFVDEYEACKERWLNLLSFAKANYGERSLQVGQVLFRIGWIEKNRMKYCEADNYYVKALEILETHKDIEPSDYIHCLCDLSLDYPECVDVENEQFLDNARFYAECAYNFATEALNNATFSDADIRKALAANAMAKYFIRIGKANKAEKYLMEAYGIWENRWDCFLDKASTMVRLGKIYVKMDIQEKAKEYFEGAIDLFTKYGNKFSSTFLDCYIELAQLYDKESNTDRSYLLWQKAYDLAKAVMVDGHPIIEKIKVKLEL